MTATIKSLESKFELYRIENIVSVQYLKGSLVITYIDDGVKTALYSSDEVMIEIM